jgi:hypothetical protein
MSESKAVRYFQVPDDIRDLLQRDGEPVPYPFAAFFAEFILSRLPNKTEAQNAIVQRLIGLLCEGKAGDKLEMHAGEWQALNEALPQLGDQKRPEMSLPVYMRVQPFYAAVFSAPASKPKGWDVAVAEAAE